MTYHCQHDHQYHNHHDIMMAVTIITTAQLSSFLSLNRVNLALGILVSMVIIHLMIIYDYDDSKDEHGGAADDDVYKRDDNYHYTTYLLQLSHIIHAFS